MSKYPKFNLRIIEAYDVVVNSPKVSAYRAPGAPAAAFAAEQVIDEICRNLSLDPIEFRLLNGARQGTRQIAGPLFGPIGFIETLEAAKNHPHYQNNQDNHPAIEMLCLDSFQIHKFFFALLLLHLL